MCLAIPGKVLEKTGNRAEVDYGGLIKAVNITLVEVDVGQYVLVHAGYAIQVMDRKEAEVTLRLWDELLSVEDDASKHGEIE